VFAGLLRDEEGVPHELLHRIGKVPPILVARSDQITGFNGGSTFISVYV